MATDDPIKDAPLSSVEFEVFGNVQGCYFTKYTRDLCRSLGIVGWVKNTKKGTIMGKMQGPKPYVDQIFAVFTSTHCALKYIIDKKKRIPENFYLNITTNFWRALAHWLTTVGSPGCQIHHTEFTNQEIIRRTSYPDFSIRF